MQQGWGKVIDFLNYYFCNAMPYHYDNPHAMRLPLYRYPQTMINKTVYSSKYTADQYRNIFAFVQENRLYSMNLTEFTLNNTVAELLAENRRLQSMCNHNFVEGFCEYCYMMKPEGK